MKVIIRSRATFCLLAFLLGALLLSPALAYAQPETGHPLKVMTRNLYQGTDYQEVLGYSAPEFFVKVDDLIDDIVANKPEARMHAVAMEIAAEQPDIVALQEATTWYFGTFGTGHYAAAIDMPKLLTDDLKSIGSPYRVIVAQDGFTIGTEESMVGPIPSATGRLIGTKMQLLILVREGLLNSGFVIDGSGSGVFQDKLSMPFLGMGLPVDRTWAFIDVTYKGRPFRFVTAHPEAFAPYYTMLQVRELLAGAAKTTRPVIMAGDFNLPVNLLPLDPTSVDNRWLNSTLMAITQAGFTDAWPVVRPKLEGLTCCQAQNLTNEESQLSERIDLILTKGVVPFSAKVVGNTPADMVEGVWPSDHAGLVGKVKIP